MSEILFHPQMCLSEAEQVAQSQGGCLAWQRGRVRIVQAQALAVRAMEAVEVGDLSGALESIRAARVAAGGVSCVLR